MNQFTIRSLMENELQFADCRHPVDLIEPQNEPLGLPEEHEDARGRLVRMFLLSIEPYSLLHDTGLVAMSALVVLRPDLLRVVAQCHFGFTEVPTCLKECEPAALHEKEAQALAELLIWCAQGNSLADVGLRTVVILRAVGIGKFAGMSFAEIGALKPCSKQRVESLDAEFRTIFNYPAS